MPKVTNKRKTSKTSNNSNKGKGTNRRPSKKSQSVVDRIEPMQPDKSGFKLLIYGRSGSGKTTFWSTFPGKILAIIVSGGKELRSVDTPENREKIDCVNLYSSMELMELVEYAKDSEYDTVVLDHVTTFQDMVLGEILEIDEIPEQKHWGLATQQEYGQCTAQCKQHLKKFMDLTEYGKNAIVIAQERAFDIDEDNELIEPSIGAALSPSLAGWVHHTADYIVQTYIRQRVVTKTTKAMKGKKKQVTKKTDEPEYCLRIGAHPTYTIKFKKPKDKSKEHNPVIVDPDYDKLMESLEAY